MDPQNNPAQPSNIGPYDQNLSEQMKRVAPSADSATLRQVQANLIETSQALTGKLADMTAESARAAANLEQLSAELKKSKKTGKQHAQLQKQVNEQTHAKAVADKLALGFNTASRTYQNSISIVAATEEARAKNAERPGKSFTFGQGVKAQVGLAAGLQGKGGGVLGEVLSSAMARAATGSLMTVGATTAVGGLYAALKLLTQMFSASTRNTTSFVESFGVSGGLYIAAQNEFKKAAGGALTMTYSLADAEKLAAVTMKDGALSNYAAVNLLKRAGQGATTTSSDMGRILGTLSTSMLLAGKAMGMTVEESGKMLGGINAMGAFSEATGSSKSHMEKLNLAMAGFMKGNDLSGIGISRMSALTGSFAASMLPLGASFKEVQAQTIGTVGALSELVKNKKAGISTYLNEADAFKKFTESLLSIGKGIAAPTMAGYQIMAGQSTGNAISDVSAAISAKPMERLSASIKNIMSLSSDNDTRTVMMSQRLPEETASILSRMMKGDPAGFNKFLGAMASKDTSALAALAKTPGMSDMSTIAKELSRGRDPIEQLVTLTQNVFDTLSGLAMGVLTWIGAPVSEKLSHLALQGMYENTSSSGRTNSAQHVMEGH